MVGAREQDAVGFAVQQAATDTGATPDAVGFADPGTGESPAVATSAGRLLQSPRKACDEGSTWLEQPRSSDLLPDDTLVSCDADVPQQQPLLPPTLGLPPPLRKGGDSSPPSPVPALGSEASAEESGLQDSLAGAPAEVAFPAVLPPPLPQLSPRASAEESSLQDSPDGAHRGVFAPAEVAFLAASPTPLLQGHPPLLGAQGRDDVEEPVATPRRGSQPPQSSSPRSPSRLPHRWEDLSTPPRGHSASPHSWAAPQPQEESQEVRRLVLPPSPPEGGAEPSSSSSRPPREVLSGQHVQVVALVQATEFNGRLGDVEDYDAAADVYVVRLAGDGPPVRAKLRPENLALAAAPTVGDALWLPPEGHDAGHTTPRAEEEGGKGGDGCSETPCARCLLVPLRSYARLVKKRPLVLTLAFVFALGLLVGLLWRPINLEEDFSALVRADGGAARERRALSEALASDRDLRSRRLHEAPGRGGQAGARALAGGRPVYLQRELLILAVAKAGNAFDERVLREVRHLELRLRDLPSWRHMCGERVTFRSERWLCDPGESLAALVWPSRVNATAAHHRWEAHFDGRGQEPLALPALLSFMEAMAPKELSRDFTRYFPKDYTAPAFPFKDLAANPPAAIKTRFTFLLTYAQEGWPMAKYRRALDEVSQDYHDFMVGEVYPILLNTPKEYTHTTFYYIEPAMMSYELREVLKNDVLWAIGSIVFVTIYMWLHIRSVLISIGCFFIIFSSVPVAYVLTPAEKTTIASFLSLFLVTVIDIDVIFIFMDFWDQSVGFKKRMDERLVWMIVHAGKSCLATTLTTSLSFFANLASVLQPLREFGMFMGLCVVSVYVLAILFLPPLIVVRERWKESASLRVVDISRGESDTLTAVHPSRRGNSKQKSQPTCMFKFLSWLVESVSRCACPVVMFVVVCFPAFLWGIIANSELDLGLPEIFPVEHNQVAGRKMAGKFHASIPLVGEDAPSDRLVACKAENMTAGRESCMLYWCSALPQVDERDATSGSCWRGPTTLLRYSGKKESVGFSTQPCGQVQVKSRFAATEVPSTAAWTRVLQGAVQGALNATFYVPSLNSDRTLQVSTMEMPLSLEDWGSGKVHMSRFFRSDVLKAYGPFGSQPASGRRRPSQTPSTLCEIQTMCFFGTPRCELPGWWSLGRHSLAEPAVPAHEAASASAAPTTTTPTTTQAQMDVAASPRLLSSAPRGLQVWVPANKQVQVQVIWGLRAPRSTPLVGPQEVLWSFDPTFEPDNPWAQRAIFQMCIDHPEELYVVTKTCWMEEFRSWLQGSPGRRFPSRSFDEDVIDWYLEHTFFAQRHLWMKDRKVKACKVDFKVNVANDVSAKAALDYKVSWDAYVDLQNREATMVGNRAWHTAPLWVRAEAQTSIVTSTASTIVIECGCGWLGILTFTGDPHLAFLVLGLLLINISGLAFFMTTVVGWSVGPIEVILLVVFLGYSVTYGLHVAHNYSAIRPGDDRLLKAAEQSRRAPQCTSKGADIESSPGADPVKIEPLTARELRVARTRLTMQKVGGALFSSTMSTIGSSVFLLVCTLTVFKKLGIVVMVVTGLSLAITLVALPAVLIVLGPAPEPCHKRCAARCKRWAAQRRGGTSPGDSQEEPLVGGQVLEVLS